MPAGTVAGGSITIATSCNAVIKACDAIRDKLVPAAVTATVNANLADYSLPVNADIPECEVLLVSERDDYVNPAGIKGSANSATSAPHLRSSTRSITRPVFACVNCRSGWKN